MSFKKDLYTEVVRVLNIPKTVVFKGGYLIGLYQTGIPYVVDQTTDSKFDYTRKKVVPVSEEIAQETPSVNLADRSDYIFQYKIMFQSNREDEVLAALDAFRTHFFTNKQLTVDGYTVSIKTSRGDKLGTRPHAGHFWTFYTIKVFATAIKNGKIWADTDTWSLKLYTIPAIDIIVGTSYMITVVANTDFTTIGASDNTVGVIFVATGVGAGLGKVVMTTVAIPTPIAYETLKITTETFSNVGTASFSSKGSKVVGVIDNTATNSKISFFYNAGDMEKQVYTWIMNKLDKNTLFNFKHTFKGDDFEYKGLITAGGRIHNPNGAIILEFDWIEADV